MYRTKNAQPSRSLRNFIWTSKADAVLKAAVKGKINKQGRLNTSILWGDILIIMRQQGCLLPDHMTGRYLGARWHNHLNPYYVHRPLNDCERAIVAREKKKHKCLNKDNKFRSLNIQGILKKETGNLFPRETCRRAYNQVMPQIVPKSEPHSVTTKPHSVDAVATTVLPSQSIFAHVSRPPSTLSDVSCKIATQPSSDAHNVEDRYLAPPSPTLSAKDSAYLEKVNSGLFLVCSAEDVVSETHVLQPLRADILDWRYGR
ncbi:MAG: hypothetical protein COB66_07810 [Coxiella sp. (in: Bacteria)]|nr:MAG: hypothetical protein COB66_07810 [Coxiella sp. (in: g-proteobacteria)]